MRPRHWLHSFVLLFPAAPFLACTTVENDRTTLSLPTAVRTQITFEPLDRNRTQRYLETERHQYRVNTEPLNNHKEALEGGRGERYREVRREFPECDRQAHCMQKISRGDVKKFERFNELAREIHEYDRQIVEIDVALRDWKYRYEVRTRAILNRFLVHEITQLPSFERRFQGVLVYSTESFQSRRQASIHLMRYASRAVQPEILGDYDFRMLGRPVDEGAVIATFEVYLMPPSGDYAQPTRYVVSMLVNTHQLDLRFYDKDFLRAWADKMVEPYQNQLREEVYCGIYAIAPDTLAPRLDISRPKLCAPMRTLMRGLDAAKFPDRFAPDRWLLPIAYFPMDRPYVK